MRTIWAPDAQAVAVEEQTADKRLRHTNLDPLPDGYWGWQPTCANSRFRYQVQRDGCWHAVLDPYADGIYDQVWGSPPDEPYWQCYLQHNFDWGDQQRPQYAWRDTVIYELHPRGFTANPNSLVRQPGTFQGLTEKLNYLQDLGVTTLELMPVWAFSETDVKRRTPDGASLRNYWGYQPLSFFALKGAYAADQEPQAVADEFKAFIKKAHAQGLEVILDVVFNHTGQIDNPHNQPGWDHLSPDYYLYKNNTLLDVTGCGNTFNAASEHGSQLVLDALRHWARNFHIDGFRYDLGATFYRDHRGEPVEQSPLVNRICEDPELAHLKHCFEPWDCAGHRIDGDLPDTLYTWDDRFRDTARETCKRRELHPELAGLLGSRRQRINCITCHDGFTLNDVVSYTHKHNSYNGEQGQDGHNHNHSFNHGVEGDTQDPAVLFQRYLSARNLLTLLLLAPDPPLINAGDEVLRTQRGNNNGYCLDNEDGWFNWVDVRKHPDMLAYVRKLLTLRRSLKQAIRSGWRCVDHPQFDLHMCSKNYQLVYNMSAELREMTVSESGLILLNSAAPDSVKPVSGQSTINVQPNSIVLCAN